MEKFTQNIDYTLTQIYRIRGKIVHGFKRGSTQLGFPTANVDPVAFSELMAGAKHGVYVGWAQVLPTECPNSAADGDDEILHCNDYGIFKCMLSLGKNVQFDATQDTLEAYIHHKFTNNFYDHTIEIIICAYIREQLSFESLEALISAIQRDVDVGDFALDYHPDLKKLESDKFFTPLIHDTNE